MAEVRVFINPGAAYGTGLGRWHAVESEIRRHVGRLAVESIEPAGFRRTLAEAVARGERRFLVAGGDGSVNLFVNAAMSLPEAAELTFGAVGLGSSNDFHKSEEDTGTIEGVPLRIDFDRAQLSDVIAIHCDEARDVRYAIVNASIGVTAEANARFNEPSRIIRAARRISVDAAISAAVLTTLVGWRDLPCTMTIDDGPPLAASVTNLGVFKNRHFGGDLRYDFAVGRNDGELGVALCERLTRREVVSTLSALRKGRFTGLPKTRSWKVRSLDVSSERRFALETDGEVMHATRARFSVAPVRLRCCA